MCGYKSSILCKIDFGLLCLTPTWGLFCKRNVQGKTFIKILAVTKNVTSNTVYCISIGTGNKIVSSCIKYIHLND